MSTVQIRVQDLATRIATECKSLRTLLNGNAAGLTALTTTNKTNLVAALNELKAEVQSLAVAGGATLNDALNASTTQTWSITKINNSITNAINAVTNGAPGALDTLAELSAALGNDANFAATVTTGLSNRVRTDTAAQGLTTQQKTNARTNIDAFGVGEIGDPTTNFVTTFNAGLV
jgi:hypothetical protein